MSTETLTLPGTIPGLLRRGSPVAGQNGERGLVLETTSHAALGDGFRVWHYAGMAAGFAAPHQINLDLTDATGRAHASWWLLARLCPHPEADVLPGWCAGWCREGLGVWVLSGLGRVWAFTGHPEAENTLGDDVELRIVAPLRMLIDARVPRLLPDGSRWVDAEALRRVVLHVAGVSP